MIAVAALTVSACGGDICNNRIADQVVSPDGTLQAVTFERDCGATTDYSTHISIVALGNSPLSTGNALIVSGGTSRENWHGVEATARWSGPNALDVTLAADSEIFFEQHSVEGVEITYRRMP